MQNVLITIIRYDIENCYLVNLSETVNFSTRGTGSVSIRTHSGLVVSGYTHVRNALWQGKEKQCLRSL